MSLDDVRARTFAIPGLPRFALPNPDGRFSVAGRVDDKGIQFLFIAEYYRGNRPLFTQSWNASGPRQ